MFWIIVDTGRSSHLIGTTEHFPSHPTAFSSAAVVMMDGMEICRATLPNAYRSDPYERATFGGILLPFTQVIGCFHFQPHTDGQVISESRKQLTL